MKLLIAMSVLLGAFFLSHGAFGGAGSGFKGIYIGQPEATLPQGLKESFSIYEGIHDGDYFQIHVMKKEVESFTIIYLGETSDRSAISKPMTLSQALQEHSLGRPSEPKLTLARGRDGQVWGLVDLTHAISYEAADPKGPESRVAQVAYIKANAPVLNARREDILDESAVQTLVKGATEKKAEQKNVAVIPPETRFSFPSRDKALSALIEQADKVIGRGKRTLALISQAEIWLGVNEEHSEAKHTFRQLRRFYRDFQYDSDTLIKLYEANKGKFKDADLAVVSEPLDLKEQIKRKMTQLKAMGFREYGPVD
ncbi:MAG: hypothetical protein AABM64_16435 [Pseudomonadota bacterium]